MSSRRAILFSLVIALGLPAPAAAQVDPGINFDPGSPAGKEYAIPLAEGRSEGAGTSDPRTGGDIPFGVGIEPPGGGSGDGSGGAGTGGSEPAGSREPGGAGGTGGRIESRGGEASRSTSLAEAESEEGTAWQTLVLALAVLLPAALLAVVLAARRPSRTGRTA